MKTSLILEAFTEADFDQLIEWLPSAESLVLWGGSAFTFPLDHRQLAKYLGASRTAPPSSLIFRARHSGDTAPVGHIEISAVDRLNESARLSRVLVAPHRRNEGLGRAIVARAARVAFEELDLHRLELSVFDSNAAAIACYEQVGFRHEGTLREARKFGSEFWNIRVMSMLKSEWRD